MTFLPIVERELRLASRRAATYWVRFGLGIGFFSIWFLLSLAAPLASATSRGQMLFTALSGLMFGFCSLAGVFLTADCISIERREGTLGLLFLTQLKGYDVTLGKLLATSLPAFYGLLSVLPLLAYAMMIGGVAPGEFWRMCLCLSLTLIFSLSLGLLVSVHNRETRRAMGVCALAILAASLLPMLLVRIVSSGLSSRGVQLLAWPSPLWGFEHAFESSYQSRGGAWHFWGSTVTLLLLSAGALALSSRNASRVWQESSKSSVEPELKPRKVSIRPRERIQLMERDPFCWLAMRDATSGTLARRILYLGIPIWLMALAFSAFEPVLLGAAAVLTYLVHHALKWLVAIEAARRMNEERQNGTLQVLLLTPLSADDLVQGQIRALRQTFRVPFLAAAMMNVIMLVVVAMGGLWARQPEYIFVACEIFIGGMLLLYVDLWAISWVGMWMGMVAKRHDRAVLSTLGRIILVPWGVCFFLILLTAGGAGMPIGTTLALSPLWFILAAVLPQAFTARAKVGLLTVFRQVASDSTLNVVHPTFLDHASQFSTPPAAAS